MFYHLAYYHQRCGNIVENWWLKTGSFRGLFISDFWLGLMKQPSRETYHPPGIGVVCMAHLTTAPRVIIRLENTIETVPDTPSGINMSKPLLDYYTPNMLGSIILIQKLIMNQQGFSSHCSLDVFYFSFV